MTLQPKPGARARGARPATVTLSQPAPKSTDGDLLPHRRRAAGRPSPSLPTATPNPGSRPTTPDSRSRTSRSSPHEAALTKQPLRSSPYEAALTKQQSAVRPAATPGAAPRT